MDLASQPQQPPLSGTPLPSLRARIPAALAFLLLAAHFSRAGIPAGIAASLLLLPVLFLPHPVALRVAQGALLLGAAEWIRTLVEYAARRQAEGRPVVRLVLILATVALFTLVSALPLGRRRAASGAASRPASA